MSKQLMMAVAAVIVITGGIAIGVASFSGGSDDNSGSDTSANSTSSPEETGDEQQAATNVDALPESEYLSNYMIDDTGYGTMVTATVDEAANTRTIVSNALPNHDTGEFPNSGNPNEISEQDRTFSFPLNPTFVGTPVEVRETGVAINGVKFEPGTAEIANCTSGQTHRIEALQDVTDLGLDFNNAHVQPTGEYHYHGISTMLADLYSNDNDLVHIGFAADGHNMYYSKSGAYASSYVLGTDAREGTGCTYTVPGPSGGDIITFGSEKDGSLTSDWDYVAGSGDLDECNGVTIGGEYVYLVTDEYPYISRCVMGEASGAGGATGGGGAPTGPPPGGGAPTGQPPQ